MNIHLKPLHLSVSQKSVAMDQVLVSQYVSGTVDTIAGKSAYSVSLTKFNIFNTESQSFTPIWKILPQFLQRVASLLVALLT